MSNFDHFHKAAVFGASEVKRTLADPLTRPTGQPLKYFESEAATKDWLVLDE